MMEKVNQKQMKILTCVLDSQEKTLPRELSPKRNPFPAAVSP